MHAIERKIAQQDWITLIILFLFILIFLLKAQKPNRLYGYFTSFFTRGFISERAEENPTLFSLFHFLLFFFSITSISIGITLITEPKFLVFLGILGGLLVYLLSINSVDILLEKLFKLENITRYFRFTKVGYLYTCALWLLPFIIIYNYGFANSYIILISIIVFLLIRVILIINNNKNLIFSNLFYFILYLCALEIAPLLFVYKIAVP